MTNLTKTTTNFAEKRGLTVETIEMSEHTALWISVEEDACEPDVIYIANENGSFTFFGNLALPQEIKEELPATVRDEKHLREVISFICEEINK